jgi:pentatricopeptide repeat protein
MPERNVASWNSLISGFVKEDKLGEALDVFRRMQREGMGFSWVTLTTILPICARVTALLSGKEIHAQIVKSARRPDVLVLNSLVDMYVKCGVVDYGRRLFDGMRSKDLTSWNTMLTGYAINGYMRVAMDLFNEMASCGIRPDDVTFIALLSGCSHAGLTEDGQKLFHRMEMDFGVSPSLEHYACLVDMLGRAGRIDDALVVVKNMPMKTSGSIWGSLLNSCRLHNEVPLAEAIANRLFELEPYNPGNYVMLSNIYANAGMWDSVNMVREMMQTRRIRKEAGCSWIQVKNKIHSFVAGGGFEFRNSDEYKKIWNKLREAMEEFGYIPNTDVVLHDVNEETKAMWVCGHSERLATVFSLIHSAAGMPIRITKNLRVCVDCHSWIKIVSRVTGRVIVLRDTNRFHHFKEGACSCNDYW